MNEIERIATLLEEIFDGEPYYGPSLRDILQPVTAAVAAARLPWSAHTIWELVTHLTAELSYARQVLAGTAGPWVEGETTWPAVADTSPAAWQRAVDDLARAHHDLRAAIRALDVALLDRDPIQVRGPYYVMLHGTLQHSVYHAGQLALLAGQLALSIPAERLELMPMTPAFLEASLARDRLAAECALGLSIPGDWYEEEGLMILRLEQLREDPAVQPWLLRAMALRGQKIMVGHIGCHAAPGAEHLRDIAPGGVEFGYTVFPPYRRQGYAREASRALMDWAHRRHGVTRFVLSISPENMPSLGLARSLGFRRVGSHVDEEDGLEDIYLKELEA